MESKTGISSFLQELANINHSTNHARVHLARKMKERSLLLHRRQGLQRRMRKLVKDLQTVEGLVQIVETDIQTLEHAVEKGSDGED